MNLRRMITQTSEVSKFPHQDRNDHIEISGFSTRIGMITQIFLH